MIYILQKIIDTNKIDKQLWNLIYINDISIKYVCLFLFFRMV